MISSKQSLLWTWQSNSATQSLSFFLKTSTNYYPTYMLATEMVQHKEHKHTVHSHTVHCQNGTNNWMKGKPKQSLNKTRAPYNLQGNRRKTSQDKKMSGKQWNWDYIPSTPLIVMAQRGKTTGKAKDCPKTWVIFLRGRWARCGLPCS